MANDYDSINWYNKPALRDPVLIAAFEGWNDAGDASSDSVAWIVDNHESQLIGEIDGENYFDYQAIRPNISVGDGGVRQISWPRNRIYSIKVADADRDLIVILGHEPNYRWKTFCNEIEKIVSEFDCREVFTLGSLMAEVPHTRPTRLSGMDSAQGRLDALEVNLSNYEGPTGIIGIIHETVTQNKINAMSLWATIPHYVAQRPQPVAMVELLNAVGALVGIDFDTSELANQAAEWIDHVNEAVAQDDQALDYVSQLEDSFDNGDFEEDYELSDDEFPTADDLADEVEKFLRDQPPE